MVPYCRAKRPENHHFNMVNLRKILLRSTQKLTYVILQWYRPRSLNNLDQDTASIWSGGGGSGSKPSPVTDQAKNTTNRSQSLGEINHGFSWDNVRPARSGQSVDNYKDVAL